MCPEQYSAHKSLAPVFRVYTYFCNPANRHFLSVVNDGLLVRRDMRHEFLLVCYYPAVYWRIDEITSFLKNFIARLGKANNKQSSQGLVQAVVNIFVGNILNGVHYTPLMLLNGLVAFFIKSSFKRKSKFRSVSFFGVRCQDCACNSTMQPVYFTFHPKNSNIKMLASLMTKKRKL